MDLLMNNRTWQVSRSWFNRHATGNYTQLHRLTPEGKDAISATSDGKEMIWLDQQLSQALSQPETHAQRWTAEMMKRTRAFQQKNASACGRYSRRRDIDAVNAGNQHHAERIDPGFACNTGCENAGEAFLMSTISLAAQRSYTTGEAVWFSYRLPVLRKRFCPHRFRTPGSVRHADGRVVRACVLGSAPPCPRPHQREQRQTGNTAFRYALCVCEQTLPASAP